MPDKPQKLKVFLCHASENKPIVQGLYDRLKADSFDPWLDSEFLLPGMDWDLEIQQAMRASDAVIVCLSEISVTKEGYVQKEIKFAQDILKEKPEGTIFLLPVQLEDCKIPYSLQAVQWGKYYEMGGYEKIVKSLEIRAKQLGRKLPEKDSGSPKGLPPGSTIPFPRNALFTGREKDLEKLSALCEPGSSNNFLISQAITGMGGIGKTQLAVEFAYRYGHAFKGVHWLDLRESDALDASIALCGTSMGLAYTDQREQVANTLHIWQTDGPRLLILDNFEDITKTGTVLSRFQHPALRLLITSRRKDFPKSVGLQTQELDTFSETESLEFLGRTLKREETEKDKKALAEKLGHLPLALELAASYININGLDIAAYLTELEDILTHESMQDDWFKELEITNPTKHEQSLLGTFKVSWKEVKNETAQKVFMLAGYCAPNTPIPREIFEKTLETEERDITKAHYRLNALGLFISSDRLPTIHPLVAAYARSSDKENEQLEKVAGTIFSLSANANQSGLPLQMQPYQQHVRACGEFAEKENLEIAGSLWNEFGYSRKQIADYAGAKAAYERALKIDEAAFGPDHPDVAIDVNNLGLVLKDLGDHAGAKAAYERALKIFRKFLPEGHPNIKVVEGNLRFLENK